jgi:hypothetical protein
MEHELVDLPPPYYLQQYSSNGSVSEALKSLFVQDAQELLERGIVSSIR